MPALVDRRYRSRISAALFATVFVFVVIGCAGDRPRADADSSAPTPEKRDPEAAFRDQLGRTWELARLGTQDIPPTRPSTRTGNPGSHPGPGTRPTIRFTADRAEATLADTGLSRAGGWSFCNGYGAAYKAGPGDALRFHQFQSTLVGCDSPDAPESRYFRALGESRRFALDSGTLRLIAADGSSLIFVPASDSAGPPSS